MADTLRLAGPETHIPQDVVDEHVRMLGYRLAEHYEGERIRAVAVLFGAQRFAKDVVAAMREAGGVHVVTDSVHVTSYNGHVSAGELRWHKDLDQAPADGDHMLLIDDAVYSGNTLDTLAGTFEAKANLESVKAATLLRAHGDDGPAALPLDVDAAFEIPLNAVVLGYGLDVGGIGRDHDGLTRFVQGPSGAWIPAHEHA